MITGLAGQQQARGARLAARQLTWRLKPGAGPAQDGSCTEPRSEVGARRLRHNNLDNMRLVSTARELAVAAKTNLASRPYDLPVIA